MVKEDFPKYYFKFLSFGEHTNDTLEKLLANQIYTSTINQLNDPFEGLWYNNHLSDKYPSDDKELKDSLDRRRVYCLCSNDSERFPYSQESITMWSHYADSHRGFCIMYSKDILNTIDQDKEVSPMRIKYSGSLAEKTGNKIRDLSILFQKSHVWELEREVRLCFRDKNDKGDSQPYREIPKSCILAIFAGCRISIINDCLLSGFSQKLGCVYNRLTPSNQSFEFNKI